MNVDIGDLERRITNNVLLRGLDDCWEMKNLLFARVLYVSFFIVIEKALANAVQCNEIINPTKYF